MHVIKIQFKGKKKRFVMIKTTRVRRSEAQNTVKGAFWREEIINKFRPLAYKGYTEGINIFFAVSMNAYMP